MRRPGPLAFAALLIANCSAAAVQSADTPGYNRDIRPILAENCFACHGPDSASRKADLRLDQREAAIEHGAIQPGQPDDSELIRRILSTDPGEMMPPPETKKTLSAEEKQKLVQWVAAQAPYELHWSFLPPHRPEPPTVQRSDWVENPIDNFILAKLEAEGLEPAPEADRRTLARRVALDLTGLPPTPAEVEEFVNDPAPDAYDKYIDRLLKSPHWGEHRGRYWLDYARYADTHGIHFDNFREMWSYRDWVISAFNRNMPFDQFTVENLAGDLIPNATLEQQIASGFNRCNMTTNEGGIIDEEYLVLYARDRTETTAQVWMGLTAGCAVCHSHKFDPLSQEEFYQLAAFFNNTTQKAKDGNIKDTPPIIVVPLEEDRARYDALQPELAAARERVEARRNAARADFDAWFASATPAVIESALPRAGLYLHAPLSEGDGRTAQVVVEGEPRELPLNESARWQDGPAGQALQVQGEALVADLADFERDQPFTCTAWIKIEANDSNGAVCSRMDRDAKYRGWDLWVQRRQVGMHIINSWPDNGLKVVGKKQVPAKKWVHVAVTYDGSSKAAGVKIYYDGQPEAVNVENDKLQDTIRTPTGFRIGQRSSGEQFGGGIQDLRIYRRALAPAEVESLAKLGRFSGILTKPVEKRTAKEKDELYSFWLSAFDAPFQELTAVVAGLEREEAELKNRGTIAHVMAEANASAMAYVLYRGEYDQRREQVSADTPAVFPKFPEEFPRNRLGLAQWLLMPDHPLTARVTVNRFWQELFGTGIVRTAGDFGISGELPSHPELLDWLAVEFRESGWDVQRLFKLIVTSSTYRQAAVATPEKLQKDPANTWLSRGPRFRMDAEMVRDYALAASGLLVPKVGGPSVKPYQPEGVWEAIAMNVSNTRAYERQSGENLYRRSMYWFWKRQAPPASMDIFNAPNREYCVVRRERTNTPLQALVTLNDEQFVEAARALAQTVIREAGESADARIRQLGLRVVARNWRPEESAIIRKSLDRLTEYYAAHPDDAAQLLKVGDAPADPQIAPEELAAWTMLANELLNLDEVLNK